ncbi:hypothetical protein [Bradyrhizobium sp. SZCCHNS3051]|uniref:hypothetical protein n=1 Tax=Bradyrhizobium sp. SZCCHNS3051 TaxID=3057320 RepID=UPI002915C9D3|nr:hypothetical protein [Bradyrhizobium sp. SZCCHNS3051]
MTLLGTSGLRGREQQSGLQSCLKAFDLNFHHQQASRASVCVRTLDAFEAELIAVNPGGRGGT